MLKSFLFLSSANRADKIREMQEAIKAMTCGIGFPKVHDFAEVDARRDNSTVEDLREKIEKLLQCFKIKREPLVGQTVPESYLR